MQFDIVWQNALKAVALVLLGASFAFAGSPKIAKDLQGKSPSGRVDVIVQFTETPTARHHQKVTSKGGSLKGVLSLVKAGSYSIPSSALAALAADPEVVYISPERPLFNTGSASNTAALDYHTETVNASAAWTAGLNGTGIGVAVIDSGIIDAPDLHAVALAGPQAPESGPRTPPAVAKPRAWRSAKHGR